MKFTAPVFILKQHAKALSRKEKIPLHQALDRIAFREGFNAWSLARSEASQGEHPVCVHGVGLIVGSLVASALPLEGIAFRIRKTDTFVELISGGSLNQIDA